MKTRKIGVLKLHWKILLIIMPIAALFIALCIGRISISPSEVFDTIMSKFSSDYEVSQIMYKTIWTIRIPRILLAILVGAGLSCAGCAFQSLFANPLATPDTLGVASGSSFGAALGILLGLGMVGMQLTSLAFGAVAVFLTWLSGSGKGRGLGSIVLSGIMIGSLFTALVSLVKFVADDESQLPSITYWLMGGLDKANYTSLLFGAPAIIVGIVIMFLLRWRMNLLPLSDDEAKASGVNIRLLRIIIIICATAITASCISLCGQVGWVGLLIPHMCRMAFGGNHLSIIPASISFGAVFMIVVDTIARTATAAEIPVSILTAIVGAPFFIFLMRRNGRWQI
ncbi:MAG: iron ABC transporter permease [Parasporobacterium sp.]|nr:iron ABC transporter permease [Parasporobacterium sp.]